jgi:hypothetical protein
MLINYTFVVMTLLTSLVVLSCSDNEGQSDCPVGAEGCPCTEGGGCDDGLTCLSDLCVEDVNGGDSDTDTDSELNDEKYQWHTFYQGGYVSIEAAFTTDASGNIYVTGSSEESWNGPDGQDPLNPFPGDPDTLVLKLNPQGEYQWHTFIGSAGWDRGSSIIVDESGNLIVLGLSAESWDGPEGQEPINMHSGESEQFFVLELDTDGNYIWHTFYRGRPSSNGALGVDGNGNIFVTGDSEYSWNGPDGQEPLNEHWSFEDASDLFILKLDSAGGYVWHTFYGAETESESGASLDVDADGNVFVLSSSRESWQGPDGETPIKPHALNWDFVVIKLDGDGQYQWHTFFGSNDHDWGYSIALDGAGDVYMTGRVQNCYGPEGQTPLNPHSGYADIGVIKLSTDGAYLWHTFYGVIDSEDYPKYIAVDDSDSIFVTGESSNVWVGPDELYSTDRWDGSADVFIFKLGQDGDYKWHTYYGGDEADVGGSIDLDKDGNIIVAGDSSYFWYGPDGQEPLNVFAPENNYFILKLADMASSD